MQGIRPGDVFLWPSNAVTTNDDPPLRCGRGELSEVVHAHLHRRLCDRNADLKIVLARLLRVGLQAPPQAGRGDHFGRGTTLPVQAFSVAEVSQLIRRLNRVAALSGQLVQSVEGANLISAVVVRMDGQKRCPRLFLIGEDAGRFQCGGDGLKLHKRRGEILNNFARDHLWRRQVVGVLK